MPPCNAGRYAISRSCEQLVALLQRSLEDACRLENGAIALSTLMAVKDIAALGTALPPVLHHRDFQVSTPVL